MSNYLGFDPNECSDYYFVSYNNEDAARVGEIAARLYQDRIPLWYDHGIEYGEKWETKISGKLAGCRAVLLFFTKGILQKESSYVRKEYTMATEYFDKKVYVVILDQVEKREIPFDKVPFWIDIQEKQCINAIGITDAAAVAQKIKEAIGASRPAAPSSVPLFEDAPTYDVILQSSGRDRLAVIKVVREFAGLGLREVMDLTKMTPAVCKWGVERSEAERIVARLREVGAEVSLRSAASAEADAEPLVEKAPTYDVILHSSGMNKLAVIKAVREFTGLGLKEAKEITESAPIVCKRGVARSEAEHIVASLREAGAEASLRG